MKSKRRLLSKINYHMIKKKEIIIIKNSLSNNLIIQKKKYKIITYYANNEIIIKKSKIILMIIIEGKKGKNIQVLYKKKNKILYNSFSSSQIPYLKEVEGVPTNYQLMTKLTRLIIQKYVLTINNPQFR